MLYSFNICFNPVQQMNYYCIHTYVFCSSVDTVLQIISIFKFCSRYILNIYKSYSMYSRLILKLYILFLKDYKYIYCKSQTAHLRWAPYIYFVRTSYICTYICTWFSLGLRIGKWTMVQGIFSNTQSTVAIHQQQAITCEYGYSLYG